MDDLQGLEEFEEVWALDFEFHQPPGDLPIPHCMVAKELRSGRVPKLWHDQMRDRCDSPIPVRDNVLCVAHFSSAEWSCYLSFGWPLPQRIIDTYVEFRCIMNGAQPACGFGLLGALAQFGLPSIDSDEKDEMRDLAMRGAPFTPQERQDLVEYCSSDVEALAALLPAMLPKIDVPRALIRGRYMAAVAHMERVGVPIDVETLNVLRANWDALKDQLIAPSTASTASMRVRRSRSTALPGTLLRGISHGRDMTRGHWICVTTPLRRWLGFTLILRRFMS